MSEKDGELELTPGYRISIPLTHVDGPEERELLRRRHPPHPDIPRNLIAQGWFESGYDTAALEFWDVVHEANRELAARDAEISSLRDQLRRVEGERDEAQRQCGELHEHLALMVRYLEEEASEGDVTRAEKLSDSLRKLQYWALPVDCPDCEGRGSQPPHGPEDGPCETCGGWTDEKRKRWEAFLNDSAFNSRRG